MKTPPRSCLVLPLATAAFLLARPALADVELGASPLPELCSISPTAPGVTRCWTRIDDFVQEIADARVCDGVHFRNSTTVGSALGQKIGKLVAERYLRSAH